MVKTREQGSESIAISSWKFVRHERMNSRTPSPEPQGLASRRIAADILEGVLRRGRSLDDQLDGGGAHPGLASLPERDRALTRRLVATVLRRLGTLAPSARPLSRARHPEGCAAGRDRAADRRRADPLARRARPCRGRSVGAARAGRPARRALCGAGQRRAAAHRAERRAAVARQGHRRARYAGLADGALAAHLRRRACACRSPPPTARSRRSTSP